MNTAVGVALVVAVLGPLLTYLAAARRLSGRIATTDAAVLWEESRSMRQDYIGQIADLRAQVAEARAQLRECEKRVEFLHEANQDLDEEVIRLKKRRRATGSH